MVSLKMPGLAQHDSRRACAARRCTFLLHAAHAVMKENPALSSLYCEKMESTASKNDIEISTAVRAKYCEICFSPLIGGLSSSARIVSAPNKRRQYTDPSETKGKGISSSRAIVIGADGPVCNFVVTRCASCSHRQRIKGTKAALFQQRKKQHILATGGEDLAQSGQFYVDVQPSRRVRTEVLLDTNGDIKTQRRGGGDKGPHGDGEADAGSQACEAETAKRRRERKKRKLLQSMLDQQSRQIQRSQQQTGGGSATDKLKAFLAGLK